MAQQNQPVPQFAFGGVVTQGHPLQRPAASSVICDNFRIMPGGWLRLRSGRRLHYLNPDVSGRFRRFYEVRLANGSGSLWHLAQYDNGAGTSYWRKAMITGVGGYIIADIEQISRAYGYSEPGFAPIATVRDRVFMYNGLGVRGAVGGTDASYPALTQWDGNLIRYVGLDNYVSGGAPTVNWADGGGGASTILYSRTAYVGLYNAATGHYGNGVLAGTIKSSDPGNVVKTGTLTVTGASALKSGYHAPGFFSPTNEQSELYYVFYATPDGGATPYLVIDSATGLPVTIPYGSGSVELKLSADNENPGLHMLDVTAEMPRTNNPPRPMSAMCYANGRVYGALAWGGQGSVYQPSGKDICAVVWSAAADDVQDRDFLGVPEESWPVTNRKFTPNGERPLHLAAAQDKTRVLVITHSGTFLLEETADGLHVWETVSTTSGIWHPASFAETPYGLVWLDQHRQIVLLAPGANRLQILSTDYSDLLPRTIAAQTPATYILDQPQLVDRYQIWIGGGKSVIHDFALGGQGYTASGWDTTAAASMLDTGGIPHHIIASRHAFTHETDPVTGLVPVSDQMDGATWAEFEADYVGQWNAFGDHSVRKEFRALDVQGDCDNSAQLGTNPASVSWYGDLAADEHAVELQKVPQSDTDRQFRGKPAGGNKKWFKFRIRMKSHTQDGGAAYEPATASGDLAPNSYGSIWGVDVTVSGGGQNRG